jgi:hypothetical protein
MCKAVEIGKRVDTLRYHPGIKNMIQKIPVDYFPPKNVAVKNIRPENKDTCSNLVIWISTMRNMNLSNCQQSYYRNIGYFEGILIHVGI